MLILEVSNTCKNLRTVITAVIGAQRVIAWRMDASHNKLGGKRRVDIFNAGH